ncbi:MAG: YfhO family protein [Candidatus Hydrogenedentes bacterium]|nr:YfhO family protein [Candidatus Hydrogenedentota bacterium]
MTAPESAPQYRYAILPLFLIAASFIVLGPTFWNGTETRQGSVGDAYENSDLYQYVYPAFDYAYTRLRGSAEREMDDMPNMRGAFPRWNPRMHCGVPLHTDPRLGLFQPLNAIFLFFPTSKALALHAFLCLFLMGLFFAMFARAMGVGYVPALIGGIVYAFCGASAAAMSRPWMAGALVWTPFVMWAVREYASRFDRAAATLAGIGTGLLILSGAYALVIAALLLILAYRLQMTLLPSADEKEPPSLLRRTQGILLMIAVAAGVAAVQWIPTAMWALGLENPLEALWNFNIAAEAPVAMRDLLAQLLSPSAGTLPGIAYVGIVPLLLIPAALFHRHRTREVAFFLLAAAGFAFVSCAGDVRMPFGFPRLAFFYPLVFCVAVLTALGADRLLTPRTTFRSRPVWLPASAVLIAAAAMIWAFGAEVRQYAVPFAAVLLLLLLFRSRWSARVCGVGFALLLVVDLTVASKNIYRHPRQDAPACYERFAPALDELREQSLGYRALLSARDLDTALTANLSMVYPISLGGGALFPLTREQALWWDRMAGSAPALARGSGNSLTSESPLPQLLNVMAVRAFLVSPQGALYGGGWGARGPRLREVPAASGLRLYVNEDALPRAYWVPSWRVAVGTQAAIDALAEPGFDRARSCVVDALSDGIGQLASSPPAVSESTPSMRDATCSVEDLKPEHVIIRVNAPQAGVTVLSDSFAPGWSATVDGKRQPILKVNGLFRGVVTPQGPCVIEFRYRPIALYAGIVIGLLTLVLMLAGGLRGLFQKA